MACWFVDAGLGMMAVQQPRRRSMSKDKKSLFNFQQEDKPEGQRAEDKSIAVKPPPKK
jgi:hypothetical protein